MNQRTRYKVNDVINNRFYQMPKFLFEDEFKPLSNDARVLYSLLRDRHDLSIVNGWVNENNEVYLIYTRNDMADMLGCSQPTLRKAIKELTEYGLMEEERLGLNRPNRIYLTSVALGITGLKDSFTPECKNLSVRSVKTFQSRVKDNFTQECKNLSSNDTDINDTDINDTNINDTDIQSVSHKISNRTSQVNKIDDRLTEIISNLHIDDLKIIYPSSNSVLDEIVLIIQDMWYSNNIKIKKDIKPQIIIRSVIGKLTTGHIGYILERLEEVSRNCTITNTKSYIENMIYSSIFEMNTSIKNELRCKGII